MKATLAELQNWLGALSSQTSPPCFLWKPNRSRSVGRRYAPLIGLLLLIAASPAPAASPVNDAFAHRTPLSGPDLTATGSNLDASKEAGEPAHAGNAGGRSVWWSWQAPASGAATIATAGSSFDTLLAVYVGSAVDGLALVSSDDNDGSQVTSRISFNAVSNQTYQIAVDGANGSVGLINLTLALDVGHFMIADKARDDFWVTDGLVYTVVETNGMVYLGGQFSFVRPNRGSGIALDMDLNEPDMTFPGVNGEVYAAVADGGGGWYIGGDFTAVGTEPRTNLAHIRGDKVVDPDWSPSVRATALGVQALALWENRLYVGGAFSAVNGSPRQSLAALEASTGALLEWNPGVDGGIHRVEALTVAGHTLYVGGSFTSLGGQPRDSLGAVDLATGAATPWAPNPRSDPNAIPISALAIACDTIYVGGIFTNIAGQPRNNLAAFDANTGLLTAWNPEANGGVFDLALSGKTLYAGGNFSVIGGQVRTRIAALDVDTGMATAWNPSADYIVRALAVWDNVVYAGGLFTQIGGRARDALAALDAVTGWAVDWNFEASGTFVDALAVSGHTVYAGGAVLSTGGKPRHNLAALDARTGEVTDWNPDANGQVYALAVSGDTIYAGGMFSWIGGEPRQRLAALDRATGRATVWDAGLNGTVNALAVSSNLLYVGGGFDDVGGDARTNLAALDAQTARATAWAPNPNDSVLALAVSRTDIYAGGDFTWIGGQLRNHLAALDAITGMAAAWNPNLSGGCQDRPSGGYPYTAIYALAVGSNTVYVGGNFFAVGTQSRNGIAAVDRTTGEATAWGAGAGFCSFVRSLGIVGNTVYAGGLFASLGGLGRNNLTGLDIGTGLATTWNPDTSYTVVALAASGRAVYAGGVFLRVNNEYRPSLAAFPPEGSPVIEDPPRSQLLLPGQTTSLEVTAVGQPTLSYQWQRHGTNLVGETNRTLAIVNAQSGDSGPYSVIVTNGLGRQQSRQAVVTVLLPVRITSQPQSQTVPPGSTITLTVTATGNPPPRYQWRLNGVNIPGATAPTFTLSDAQPTNGGSYSVVVANLGGAVNSDLATVVVTSPTLLLADNFEARKTLNAASGVGRGSNVGATAQAGETNHVGKVGGKSVWLGWRAPDSGIASFSTRGSSFDTLLAIYAGRDLGNLTAVAADEDRGGFLTSHASFNAVAGTRYVIAVDGFGGDAGDIVLSWSLDTSTVAFPRITAQPLSQSRLAGAEASFSVTASSPTPMTYQWYFGCRPLPEATNATLTISNVQRSDVGGYRVLVINASATVAESFVAFLEIGPDPKALSQDKAQDLFGDLTVGNGLRFAPAPGKRASAPATVPGFGGFLPVAAGSTDSQILDNTAGSKQQWEPNHCGEPGGASQWFGLQASAPGALVIDTIGSTFDTVLAVYTGQTNYSDPFTFWAGLRPVACDNNGAPDRIRSLVIFPAQRDTNYFVAVDGVHNARGTIHLTWRLVAPPLSLPPPPRQIAALGSELDLNALFFQSQSPGLRFQWRWNGTNLPGATNGSLVLSDLKLAQGGEYSVMVRNEAGRVTNVLARLIVAEMGYALDRALGQLRLQGTASDRIQLEASSDLANWLSVYTNAVGSTRFDFLDPQVHIRPQQLYRLRPWVR